MQGAILPDKTIVIRISFPHLFFFFPSCALCLTRYDETWTVNQSSHTGPDSHIFYYFIIKLCAVSIRRKTRRVGYNNVARRLYDLTNLTGRYSVDFCPYSAPLWVPSLVAEKRKSSMKRSSLGFHMADWIEIILLPKYCCDFKAPCFKIILLPLQIELLIQKIYIKRECIILYYNIIQLKIVIILHRNSLKIYRKKYI